MSPSAPTTMPSAPSRSSVGPRSPSHVPSSRSKRPTLSLLKLHTNSSSPLSFDEPLSLDSDDVVDELVSSLLLGPYDVDAPLLDAPLLDAPLLDAPLLDVSAAGEGSFEPQPTIDNTHTKRSDRMPGGCPSAAPRSI